MPPLRLVTLAPLDELGNQAVESLGQLVEALLPKDYGKALAQLRDPSEVAQVRNQLLQLEHIQALEAAGWEVERRANRYVVHHLLVGELASAQKVQAFVEAIRNVSLEDPIFPVIYATNFQQTPWPFRENMPCSYVLTSRREDGLALTPERVTENLSLMLFFLLFPGSSQVLEGQPEEVRLFGLSGFQGLLGPLQRRLGEKLAYEVLQEEQDSSVITAAGRSDPQSVRQLVEQFNWGYFVAQLFNPQRAQELHLDPIPARGEIVQQGSELAVGASMLRGPFLTDFRPREELLWPQRIRALARLVKMSALSLWASTLKAVQQRLKRQHVEAFLAFLRQVLYQTQHGPAWAQECLAQVDGQLKLKPRVKKSAMGRQLDSWLEKLQQALQEIPNPLALSLRLALLLSLVLVLLWTAVKTLYLPPKANFFGNLGTFGVLAGGIAYAFFHIHRAWKNVVLARDGALDSILGEAADALAHNAVLCLQELGFVLKQQVEQGKQLLEKFTQALQSCLAELQARLSQDLPTDKALVSLLSSPKEVALAYGSLRLDRREALAKALEEGLLAQLGTKLEKGESPASWLQECFLPWCAGQVQAQGSLRALNLPTLLEIRRQAGGSGDLGQLIGQLKARAVLCGPGPFAGEPQAVFLVPEVFRGPAQQNQQGVPVVSLGEVQLLLCLRYVPLRVG